ncbi:MAG: hypothetical protein LBP23_08735 [Treponema sp.]|nr:hypothetical protein [Treponema sp.]
MKKLCVVLLIGLAVSAVVSAADRYTVQSVAGKVEREVSPGKWEAVTAGTSLTGATVINTGINSTLVIKSGDRSVTVPAMKKGTVETLAASGGGAGIKISGKVSSSDAAVSARGTINTSTASTRASDAAEDLEWEE